VTAAQPYEDIFGKTWEKSPEGFLLGYKGLEFIPADPPLGLTAFPLSPCHDDDDDDDDDDD
jgi:hypothetical protein